MGRAGRLKAPSNSPMGWETGRHGEVNHGPTMGSLATGKCPELRDGREVSAGVRVDLEIPGSMA